MQVSGQVEDGLGRGADYVGMEEYQERFREKLGFSPFPGTLNLRMDEEGLEEIESRSPSETIEGFEVEGERYSAVDAYMVEVEGLEAAILEMEITDHPPEVAEIVAPVNLREELELEDGEEVDVRPR
ncbi:MAG: DUF120 domain-containing protein [Candidatus Nanohaloarchaea archaeon]